MSQMNVEFQKKKVIMFFKQMKVKFMGPSLINKLFDGGYTSLRSIFTLTSDQLQHLPGIKQKSAEKILASISQATQHVSLPRLMAASGLFGAGFADKKCSAIISHFPTLIRDYKDTPACKDEFVKKIQGIGGFSKTASSFVDHIAEFQAFVSSHSITYML